MGRGEGGWGWVGGGVVFAKIKDRLEPINDMKLSGCDHKGSRLDWKCSQLDLTYSQLDLTCSKLGIKCSRFDSTGSQPVLTSS